MYDQSEAQDKAAYPTTAKAIETPIARMNSAQERLHSTLDELEKVLEPILGGESPMSEVAPDEPPGTFLHNTARGIEQQTVRLRRIISRVELG